MTPFEFWTLVMSGVALLFSITSMGLSWCERNKRLELEKRWRREDREDAKRARLEDAAKHAASDFSERLKAFRDCMDKHERATGLAESVACGLALFKSDDEIRQVDAAYQKSNVRGSSVFGNLEADFKGKDAKKLLDAWQAKSHEEQKQAGGLTEFVQSWPKKPDA